MPGYKVFLQNGGEIREGLTCSYCKLLLKDPVQTSESGLRLCTGCFIKATKDPYADGLDPYDKAWPDIAVKREIANLKVKCENYMIGCDWEGLFKQLMQHSQQCQYVTVECDCGCHVLLVEMEFHLNNECPWRLVKCKGCGEEMSFIQLQSHDEVCPNAVKMCRNCSKQFPACQLVDHMTWECQHVRCVCGEGDPFKVNDQSFGAHLKDVDKLADHLKPIISESTKMFEVVQQLLRKMSAVERKNNIFKKDLKQANERIEQLEMRAVEEETSKQMLKDRVEAVEKENIHLTELHDKAYHSLFKQIDQLVVKVSELNDDLREMKTQTNENHAEVLAQLEGINTTAVASSSRATSLDQPSTDLIEQVEEKVLELECILNAISAARNLELELQLQASLTNAHDGTFLWRIPEVRQSIRDAVIGHITSIDSPPFYTGRNGYKMCIRAYLNGDGSGEGTHLSIFFVLMKGEYDPLLQWPFESEVSLILVDQDHIKHLVQTFKPNAQSSSFQKPKTSMNVASGCPEFAELSILDNTSYVKDDVMYIKAVVDTSKIFHP